MADDTRPMFDDEDLPDWLVRAGITYGGSAGHAAAVGTPDTPDWLSDAIGEPDYGDRLPTRPPWAVDSPFEAVESASVTPPWMSAEASGAGGNGDMPPPPTMAWFQNEAPQPLPAVTQSGAAPGEGTAASDDLDLPTLDWGATENQTAAPEPSGFGLTGMLPWRQETAGPTMPSDTFPDEPMPWDLEPAAPGEAVPGAIADNDPWLSDFILSETEASTPPAASAAPADDLAWLDESLFTAEGRPIESPMEQAAAPAQSALTPTDFAADLGLSDDEPLPWEMPDTMTGTATPAAPAAEDDIDLDWLSAPEPAAAALTAPQTPPDELDWLAETAPDVQLPEAVSTVPEAALEESPDDLMAELPDWFSRMEPPSPAMPGTLAPSESLAEDVPGDDLDWMGDTAQAEADINLDALFGGAGSDAVPMPDAFEDDDPSWLTDPVPRTPTGPLTPSAPAEPARPIEKPSAPQPDVSDIPDWMRDMLPPAPATGTPRASAGAALPTEQVPDWLAGLEESESDVSAPLQPAQGRVSTPDSPPASQQPAARSDSLDFDLEGDSLTGIPDIDALLNLPSSSSAGLPAVPDQGANLPALPLDFEAQDQDLEKLLGPAPVQPAEPPPGMPVITPLPSAGVPPGIQPLPAPPPAATTLPGRVTMPVPPGKTGVPAAPPPAVELPPADAGEELAAVVPEWMEDLRPAGPVELRILDQRVTVNEVPITTLPDQIRQLRDRVKQRAQPTDPSTPSSAGPLAGITNAIGPASDVLKPTTTPTIIGAVVTASQLQNAEALADILNVQDEILKRRAKNEELREAEEADTPVSAPPVARARLKPDRILISLLLAIVIVAPFFTSLLNIVSTPSLGALSPDQRARYDAVTNAVNSVTAGAPVLVAFEYGPTGSGELDELAAAVLRDLIRLGARPVIVSTNPSGAMHAHRLIAGLAANPDDLRLMGRSVPLVARQDYIVLRYLPGGAGGVRTLASALFAGGFQGQVVFSTDLEGKPSGLDDAALAALRANPAFVLTETQSDVRNWAEQYFAPAGQPPLRLALLSSVAASASARAYTDNLRIVGPLTGLRDAYIYREARGQYADDTERLRAGQRWQSIGLAALLSAGIVLLGTAINLIRTLRRRSAR